MTMLRSWSLALLGLMSVMTFQKIVYFSMLSILKYTKIRILSQYSLLSIKKIRAQAVKSGNHAKNVQFVDNDSTEEVCTGRKHNSKEFDGNRYRRDLKIL